MVFYGFMVKKRDKEKVKINLWWRWELFWGWYVMEEANIVKSFAMGKWLWTNHVAWEMMMTIWDEDPKVGIGRHQIISAVSRCQHPFRGYVAHVANDKCLYLLLCQHLHRHLDYQLYKYYHVMISLRLQLCDHISASNVGCSEIGYDRHRG